MARETRKVNKMKKAAIDHILVWIVMFVSFIMVLLLVMDYSMIMRMKGHVDQISQYSARMVAVGKDDSDIVTGINSMKYNYFKDVTIDDIVCSTTSAGSYKVVFTVQGLYTDTRVLGARDEIVSQSAVFNELSSNEVNCSLTLEKN